MTPRRLTRPYVGLNPVTPQYEDGIRTDPAVSVPNVPKQRSAATAAPNRPKTRRDVVQRPGVVHSAEVTHIRSSAVGEFMKI